MKNFISVVTTIILLSLLLVNCSNNHDIQNNESSPYLVCSNQVYALCTSAPCVQDPSDPNTTICLCDVIKDGPMVSLNTLPVNGGNCDDLKPITRHGLTYIYSTYSTEQMERKNGEGTGDKKFITCKGNAAWSDCLNKLCVINPDGVTATCFCRKVTDGTPFVTLGGNCNHEVCPDSLWSAATIQSVASASVYLNNWLEDNQMNELIKEPNHCFND